VAGHNQAYDGADDPLSVGVPLRLRKVWYHDTLENRYLACEFVEARGQLVEKILQRGGDSELREVLLVDFLGGLGIEVRVIYPIDPGELLPLFQKRGLVPSLNLLTPNGELFFAAGHFLPAVLPKNLDGLRDLSMQVPA
jgi:hypothetical protein